VPQEPVVRPARIAALCGAIVAALGLLILFAWVVGDESIKTLQPGWPTMKANTALGFLASGSALLLCALGRDRWARGPAALALAIGALTLAQYLFGVDLGIDELLFRDAGSAAGTTAPGRLAILTAADFVLVSLPLLTWRWPTRAGTLAFLLAGFIALFNLAFYLLGAIPPIQGTRMAVHTAVAFGLLSLGGLAGRDGELVRVFLGRSEAGSMARRLMLPVVGLPLLFGLLARESVHSGILSTDEARAFALFGNLTALAVLVGVALVRLHRESTRRGALEAERATLQASMTASAKQLRTIFAHSPAGIILTRKDGTVVDLNEAAETLWGRPRSAFLDPAFRMEQLYADPSERAQVVQALQDKHGGAVELRMKRGDGQVRRMSFSVAVIDLGGEQVFLASGLDITELRESEERFRLLFESNPVALAIWRAEGGGLVDVNAAFEQLVGHPRETILDPAFDGRQFLEAFHETAGADSLEAVVRRADGSQRTTVATIRPFDLKGQACFLGAFQDVTLAKKAEAEVRRAQERFARIFEASPVAISLTKDDGRIVDANPAMVHLTGYERDELLAPGFRASTLYDDPADRDRVLSALRTSGLVRGAQVGLRRKDGEPRMALVSLEFVDLGGSTTILSLFQDITDRQNEQADRERRIATEAELERLRRTDEFRTQFINSTAHELRTPMTSLLMSLGAMQHRHAGDEASARSLATLQRAADRLNRVVADMVAAADLQARAISIERQRLDLSRQVKAAVAGHLAVAQRANLRLEEGPDEHLFVLADEQRLQLALGHLLGNAIKFTPAGGTVTITTRRQEGMARIEVADTGIGLTAAQRERLWGPFVQEHDKAQRTDSGSGLGLYITAGVVALHGGEVGCSSPGPGKGSTFWFTLPLAPGS
jgi:PAS domain S-box-containing protein